MKTETLLAIRQFSTDDSIPYWKKLALSALVNAPDDEKDGMRDFRNKFDERMKDWQTKKTKKATEKQKRND